MNHGLAIICLLLMLIGAPVMAQERGQYIPGFAGLNSGIQAPPGPTYVNMFTWYPANKFKDNNGNKAAINFDLDLLVDLNLLTYTTKKKFLGATYGASIGVPFVNTPISLPRLGQGINPSGLGDLYLEPINLGWKGKKAETRFVYSIIAPTGEFSTPNKTTTTDYWGHDITVARTFYLDPNHLKQFSISTNWEFHQKKRHEELKVGNNVTLEAGAGKVFVKNKGQQLIQFGVVGYAEFQLTKDSGSAAPLATINNKDRVFAIGPELGVILPTKGFNFLVRVLPEFAARNRTQGVTVMAGFAKSF